MCTHRERRACAAGISRQGHRKGKKKNDNGNGLKRPSRTSERSGELQRPPLYPLLEGQPESNGETQLRKRLTAARRIRKMLGPTGEIYRLEQSINKLEDERKRAP